MTQASTRRSGQDVLSHPTDRGSLQAGDPAVHHTNGISNGKHLGEEDDLTFPGLPPFPDDVPIAPLYRLSLKKLLDRDPIEEDRLWKACCELGFFYLDLRSGHSEPSKRDSFHSHHASTGDPNSDGSDINGDALLQDVEALFPLGEQVFALPPAEKQKYDFHGQNSYYGYKGLGAGVIDARGTRDRNEFYNVSKDDVLHLSTPPLPAPAILRHDASRALLERYIRRAHAVVTWLLARLNARLGLPPDTLPRLHRLHAVSGDQVRWVHSPPQTLSEKQLALGQHTDFGSITILFNRLGGLQILPPGSGEEWDYVKPLRGHCVVNLGDAMVKFSAGVLRSNIHRVVSPPGAQANSARMSLVYFSRPEDQVLLKPLEGSEMIDASRKEMGAEAGEEEEVTAKEWILRRALGRRVGGDYAKSNGTEGGRVQM